MKKPIILYNTSIEALLQKKEQYLRKLKNVFDVFEECKDVVLLWRPHPLFLDTIKAMLPELQDEYINLVNWYKERQIGIYDDTTDLDRAMTISDAYYGDGSSLVELYDLLNKPILIQNSNIMSSKFGYVPRVALITMCLLDDSRLFYVPRVGSSAFVVHNGNVIKQMQFDEVKNNKKDYRDAVVNRVIRCGKDLFIVMYNGPVVIKYNWETNRTEYVSIEGGIEARYELFKDGEQVYLINMETMNVYRYDNDKKIFAVIKLENRKVELWCKRCVNSDSIVAFYDKKNIAIYIYDIKGNNWVTLGELPDRIKYVFAIEEQIWTVTENNHLYVKKNIGEPWERILFNVPQRIGILVDAGELVKVYFNRGNMCLEIHKKTMICQERKVEILSGDYYYIFSEIGNNRICVFRHRLNEGTYLWQDIEDRYSIFNLLTDDEESKYNFYEVFNSEFECSELVIDSRLKKLNKNIIYEQDRRNLRAFMKWVCMQEKNEGNDNLSNYGKRIHDFMMNL